MTELILWKDNEISRLRKDIDLLFDRFCACFGLPVSQEISREALTVELSETENAFFLTAEIPGMDREDLSVTVTGDTLIIRGETARETVQGEETHRRVERSAKTISRTIPLPPGVNVGRMDAVYKNDVLKVVMPKLEPEKTAPRTVTVK